VYRDGVIDFAPLSEQTPQGKVQLDRIGVHFNHLN
jgi:hypothetical protein